MTAVHGARPADAAFDRAADEALILDLDGYEGPIDLLLTLAREQKIDLAQISILALADQYLAFIGEARRLRLEIAADYLVMAAWLAYLKSRLLLPEPPPEAEPSAAELAEHFARRLALLDAMQKAGVSLMARPLLGRDVFARGRPDGIRIVLKPVYRLDLYELLKAYGDGFRRSTAQVLAVEPTHFQSMEDALIRLSSLIGSLPGWTELSRFLPEETDSTLGADLGRRSALAAAFAATLELARAGKVVLRQDRAFGPLYLRSPVEPAA